MNEISYKAENLKAQFGDLAALQDKTLSPLLEVIAEKFIYILQHCDAEKYNITAVRYLGSGFLGASYEIITGGKFVSLRFQKSNIYSSPPNYNVSTSIFSLVDSIKFECYDDRAPMLALKGLEQFVKEQSLGELKEQASKILQKGQYHGRLDYEICEFYSIKN